MAPTGMNLLAHLKLVGMTSLGGITQFRLSFEHVALTVNHIWQSPAKWRLIWPPFPGQFGEAMSSRV